MMEILARILSITSLPQKNYQPDKMPTYQILL